MEFRRTYKNHMIILSFLLLASLLHGWSYDTSSHENIPVGVILDMEAGPLSAGKKVCSSIFMAISDFYSSNHHDEYRTRLVLHTRDSKGDPLQALLLALDLLENLKVQAIIIGPEALLEAKLLSILRNKFEVPILSLTTSPSFISTALHPYFLQMTQAETIQWKAISALVKSFKWKDVILVHEDSELGRESLPYIIDSFQEKKIHISYKSKISLLATDDQILVELHKLTNLQETVFIVHVSLSLAFRLLVHSKRLGLMTKGYAWILTDYSMNFFDPLELDEEVLGSFQGVLGLRYHVPSSTQFHSYCRRWRKEYPYNNPDIFSVLAYDAIVALAMAIERAENGSSEDRNNIDVMMAMDFTNIQASGTRKLVLKELLNITFKGLSGDFDLLNGKAVAKPLEIVNVVGNGERRVGFWAEADGIITYLLSNPNHRHSYPLNGLETIIWPGVLITPPRRRILQTSKKLRIAVPMLVGFEELLNVEYNPQTKVTTAEGFCIDVFKAALEALPYEVPYDFVPFSAERLNSEVYDQLIFQVHLQNFDAVVGDTTITDNRSLYVDFTVPYTDLGVGTVARDSYNQRKMWWFMEPLDTSMWVATTCSFFIIGATIWLIEYPINRTFQGSWQDVVGSALWFSFSTLTFSHRVKLLSNLSRLLVIVWLFIVFVIVTSYNAALSSMLTVQQIELTRRGIYVGYKAGSYLEGVIVNKSNFKDPSLLPYSSLDEYARALSEGSKKGGVVAIMDEYPYIKLFLAKYGSPYHLVSYEPNTNGFGFVFPKGSQLARDLSREILKLREEGELLKLEKKWFGQDSSLLPEGSQAEKLTVLTLYNFRGLFMIGGIFLALVPLVFLVHYMYTYSFLVYYILIDPRLAWQLLNLI